MRLLLLAFFLISCAQKQTTYHKTKFEQNGECHFSEEVTSLRLLKDFSDGEILHGFLHLENHRIPLSVKDDQLGDDYSLLKGKRVFLHRVPSSMSLEQKGSVKTQGQIKWQEDTEPWRAVDEKKRLELASKGFAFDEYKGLKFYGEGFILLGRRYRLCPTKRYGEIKKVMENRLARNAFIGQESRHKKQLDFIQGDLSVLEGQYSQSTILEVERPSPPLQESLKPLLQKWKKTHQVYQVEKKWLLIPKAMAKRGRLFHWPHKEVPWAFRFRFPGKKFWVLAPVNKIQSPDFLAWLKRDRRSYILIEKNLKPEEELYSYESLQPLIYYNIQTQGRSPASLSGGTRLWILEGKKSQTSPYLQESSVGNWSIIFP